MADGVVGIRQALEPDRLVDNEVVVNGAGQTVYRQRVQAVGMATEATLVSVLEAVLARPLPAYIYHQGTPASTWTIDHGLGFNPNVTVQDSGGATIEGDVQYPSLDRIVITFSGQFSGKAYLS